MQDGQTQIEQKDIKPPRSLFKPASWAAKINFINHLILLNNVLITVIAEKEGGKSSFKTLLQTNLDKQIKSLSMTIEPPCNEATIIDALTAQFHLNRTPETDIASIVAQINERKAHVLLIIDDAQNLPETLVKHILWAIKSQGDFGFFHVCLVSDYSIVASLNQLADSQLNNLIHTIELGPLSESEMRTYVLQRAMTAQLIHKPLAENQLKKFYRYSKGNIANINKNLESYIKQSTKSKAFDINPKIVKSAGISVAAVTALGLSYVYLDGFSHWPHFPYMGNSTVPASVEQTIIPDRLSTQANSALKGSPNSSVSAESHALDDKPLASNIPSLLEYSNIELLDVTQALEKQVQTIEKTLLQPETQERVAQEDQMRQEGPQEAFAPQADSDVQNGQASQEEQKSPKENLSQERASSDTSIPLSSSDVEEPALLMSAARLSANHTYQDQLTAQKTAAMTKHAKIAKAKPKSLSKPKSKTITKAAANIVLKGGYTIQLTASHNIRDIQRFKKSNKIFAKTKVRHFVNGQGHWYILTYGDYKNKDQAQAHVSGLPHQFSKLNPWIRTLSGLNVVG